MRRSVFFRRLIAAAVLVAFAWVCAGSVLWRAMRTLHYRWARAESVYKTKDTVAIDANTTVVWIEEDELQINGHMFDVAKQVNVSGAVVLIGHYDRWDDELFGVLRRLLEDDAPGDAHSRRRQFFWPEAATVASFEISLSRLQPITALMCECTPPRWKSQPQEPAKVPPEKCLSHPFLLCCATPAERNLHPFV